MKFNDQQMRTVAAAVIRFNPYCKGCSVDYIDAQMRQVAYQSLQDGSGYVSTAGFVLSAYKDPSTGETAVHASVASYLFEEGEVS